MTDTVEAALTFPCGDAKLVGILHLPTAPNRRGVVVVVGGPQYRAGSHRQFVLLARDLAEAGYAVLRFDYRGMGDSAGDFAGFEAVETDIRAAVDTLCDRVPGVGEVVLWGLCDGAAAIAFYAAGDPRVTGIVLINPWVREPSSLARVRIHHYYLPRLASLSFWRRLIGLEIGLARSLRAGIGTLGAAVLGPLWRRREPTGRSSERRPSGTLPERVAGSLRRFPGQALVVLSGNDLTAQEFEGSVLNARSMRRWRRRSQVTVRLLPEADHTYSTRASRQKVHDWTRDWLESS